MSDVAKITGLMKRGNTSSLRTFVPQDIVQSFGKREIVSALGTSDKAEAERLAKLKTAEHVRLFDDHRRTLADAPQKPAGALPAIPAGLTPADIARLSVKLAQAHYVTVKHQDVVARADLFARVSASEA